MNKLDEILRHPRSKEIADYQDYIALRTIHSNKGSHSASEAKRYARVRKRLRTAGVIRPVSEERLRATAMKMYKNLPWHKRTWIKICFRFNLAKLWIVGK